MIENLPIYIGVIFGLTVLLTLLLFIRAIRQSTAEQTRKKAIPVLFALVIWLSLQAILTLKNVYNAETDLFPPKIMQFGIFPAILTIIILFLLPAGRKFIDSLPLKNLTWLNIVRIPVELVLYWLFLHKTIPELMTFTGRNFDILAGITAPFIAYLGFAKGTMKRQVILIWNFICLGLLLNIVLSALFSAPSPIQKFAFDQPNIAILYFPFSWLPTFVVPVILLGHLVSIRQLLKKS